MSSTISASKKEKSKKEKLAVRGATQYSYRKAKRNLVEKNLTRLKKIIGTEGKV